MEISHQKSNLASQEQELLFANFGTYGDVVISVLLLRDESTAQRFELSYSMAARAGLFDRRI
jgi:hypothetical protein